MIRTCEVGCSKRTERSRTMHPWLFVYPPCFLPQYSSPYLASLSPFSIKRLFDHLFEGEVGGAQLGGNEDLTQKRAGGLLGTTRIGFEWLPSWNTLKPIRPGSHSRVVCMNFYIHRAIHLQPRHHLGQKNELSTFKLSWCKCSVSSRWLWSREESHRDRSPSEHKNIHIWCRLVNVGSTTFNDNLN